MDDSDLRITIPATATTGTAWFDLIPVDDLTLQSANRSVTVTGSSTGLGGGSVTGTSVTIDDDEAAAVNLSLDRTSVDEDAGTVAVKVTAAFAFPDEQRRAAATDIAVTVGAESDTATGGTDYATPSPFTITIPANQTSATASFNLPVSDNLAANPDKTLTVTGVNRTPGWPVAPASLTILDNESAIRLSLDKTEVSEGDGAQTITVTAALSEGRTETTATEVTVDVVGESGGFAAVPRFTITIPDRTRSATGSFTFTPDVDTTAEGVSRVTVQGTSDRLDVYPAYLSIIDDDNLITLSVDTALVAEGTAAEVEVTAALPAATTPLPRDMRVRVGVLSGSSTAVAGEDYQAVPDFDVEIEGGSRSGSATFTLTTFADQADEVAENITLGVISVSRRDPDVDDPDIPGETMEAETFTALSIFRTESADLHITAPRLLTVAVSPSRVTEGSTTTLTASAALPEGMDPITENVAVTVSLAADGTEAGGSAEAADFTPVSAVINITASPGSPFTSASPAATQDFTLVAASDADRDDETIKVSASASGYGIASSFVTIADDGAPPPRPDPPAINLRADVLRVGEDSGTTAVTVTAEYADGASRAAPVIVETELANYAGYATAPDDYAAVAKFNITIPANATKASGSFNLTVVDDALAEGDERVRIIGRETAASPGPATGSIPPGTDSGLTGYAVNAADIVITDNDDTLFFSLTPLFLDEAAGAAQLAYEVGLASGVTPLTEDLEITISAASGTAVLGTDFTAAAQWVVSLPQNTRTVSGFLDVTLIEDDLAEGYEFFETSAAAPGLKTSAISVFINDDDQRINLSVDPYRISEDSGSGAASRITEVTVTAFLPGSTPGVVLPGEPVRATPLKIPVSVAADTAGSADFTAAPDSFTITIPAGASEGSASFNLTVADDRVAEGGENIIVRAGDPFQVHSPVYTSVRSITTSSLAPGHPTVTIVDDDAEDIVLSVSRSSAAENDGPIPLTVTATLRESVARLRTAAEVTLSTSGSSAAPNADFSLTDGTGGTGPFTITIPAGQRSASADLTLSLVNDRSREGSEAVVFSGSAPTFNVVPAAPLIIFDDDTAIALSVSPAALEEDSGATSLTVTAALPPGETAPAGGPITVALTAAGDSAPGRAEEGAGKDFTAVRPDPFQITIPAGINAASVIFTLTVLNDAVSEGAETVTISGAAPGRAVSPATVTILGNDGETAALGSGGCSDGTWVADPASALVGDCQQLVAMRNLWLANPDNAGLPADHPLRLWGSGLVDSWPGVTATGGRVTGLNLSNGNLAGKIPGQISSLTALTSLNLGGNNLSGSIPSLSALTALTSLNLGGNNLSGSIPALSALTALTSLNLGGNNLSGAIPAAVTSLSSLTSLDLGGNNLSGSIPALSALTALTSLNLGGNDLSGAFPPVTALTSLEGLDVSDNKLSGPLPSAWSSLTALARLDVSGNRLTGSIPAGLGGLSALTEFGFCGNGFTGALPAGLASGAVLPGYDPAAGVGGMPAGGGFAGKPGRHGRRGGRGDNGHRRVGRLRRGGGTGLARTGHAGVGVGRRRHGGGQ